MRRHTLYPAMSITSDGPWTAVRASASLRDGGDTKAPTAGQPMLGVLGSSAETSSPLAFTEIGLWYAGREGALEGRARVNKGYSTAGLSRGLTSRAELLRGHGLCYDVVPGECEAEIDSTGCASVDESGYDLCMIDASSGGVPAAASERCLLHGKSPSTYVTSCLAQRCTSSM